MENTGELAGRTIFITGASRGIGKAIALKCARDGANVVIAAKTAEPHPKLPGTIYTAAEEIEAAGGKCLPCIVDIRFEDQVQSAVEQAVQKFGGIDVLVNNASAISPTGTLATPMKTYDLMNNINARGTFMVSQKCLPYLKKSKKNPHILSNCPPLNMSARWFKNNVAYTIAKYGMSMCVLGMAEEFRDDGIGVNALWPKKVISTAATDNVIGFPRHMCRKADIMADAAYVMITRDSRTYTGNFATDEDVLREAGVKDFEQYAYVPGNPIMPCGFLDHTQEEMDMRLHLMGSAGTARAAKASKLELAGRTIFITGASRGIGKAIALKCARDGANVVIAAKTAEPHPKLPGTIYTAAEEIEAAGGKCLPCIVDVRFEDQVQSAVEQAVQKFGGIDVLVNNASAISLTGTLETPMKRYDLMNNINTRGTYMVSQKCLPYLKKSQRNPHILNISPPLNMTAVWFKGHVAYTMAKYGMSMCVLGMAEEFRDDGIGVNALWPRTTIGTAAIDATGRGRGGSRSTDIMADAAYAMLTRDGRSYTGNLAIDEDILRDAGVRDFEQYSCVPGHDLYPDLFMDETMEELNKERPSVTSRGTAGTSKTSKL